MQTEIIVKLEILELNVAISRKKSQVSTYISKTLIATYGLYFQF